MSKNVLWLIVGLFVLLTVLASMPGSNLVPTPTPNLPTVSIWSPDDGDTLLLAPYKLRFRAQGLAVSFAPGGAGEGGGAAGRTGGGGGTPMVWDPYTYSFQTSSWGGVGDVEIRVNGEYFDLHLVDSVEGGDHLGEYIWTPPAPGTYTISMRASNRPPGPGWWSEREYGPPTEVQVTVVDTAAWLNNTLIAWGGSDGCSPSLEMHIDLSEAAQLPPADQPVAVLAPLAFGSSDLLYLPSDGAPVPISLNENDQFSVSGLASETEVIEFKPGQDIVVPETQPEQLPDYVIPSNAFQDGLGLAPTPPGAEAPPLPFGAGAFAYGLSAGEEGIIINNLPGGEEGIVVIGGQPGEQEGIVVIGGQPGEQEGIVSLPSLTEAELQAGLPILLNISTPPRDDQIPPPDDQSPPSGAQALFIPTGGPLPGGVYPGLLLQTVKTAESSGWLVQKAALAPADGGGYILFATPPDNGSDPFQIMAAAQADCAFQPGREGGIAPCTLPPGFIPSSGMPGQLIVGFSLDGILAGNAALVELHPPPACMADPTQTPGLATTLLPEAGAPTPTYTLPPPTPTNTPLPPTPTNTPVPPSDEDPTPTRERGQPPTPTDCPIDPETGEELCG